MQRGRIGRCLYVPGMAALKNPRTPIINCINNTEARVDTKVDVELGSADFERIARGAKYYIKCAALEKDEPGEEWLFGCTREQVFTMSGTYTFTEVVSRTLLDTECGPDEIFARYKVVVVEGGVKKNEALLDSAVTVVEL